MGFVMSLQGTSQLFIVPHVLACVLVRSDQPHKTGSPKDEGVGIDAFESLCSYRRSHTRLRTSVVGAAADADLSNPSKISPSTSEEETKRCTRCV